MRWKGIEVIEISSSDEDAGDERTGKKTGKKRPLEKKEKAGKKGRSVKEDKTEKKEVKDMEESDCIILDSNPFDPADVTKKLPVPGADKDISIIAERGQVACRDFPHSRHLCVKFPFSRTLPEKYCEQCYCYVCDSKAPCQNWKGSEPEHCRASDKEWKWRSLRREATQQGEKPHPPKPSSSAVPPAATRGCAGDYCFLRYYERRP
ncbi:hypothetical protein H6P81_010664 [Aristolochia fimbriata]|uniref:Uncharacterized protein n=1 Tax=Aristolochia fimbriata TaxID=158543 RepID=A0AAV7EQJ8_ARIFI|nr:hypothetical protein H6P81_010664 [Aristolochia fimbriata]